ncbi:MAG: hypothetical protein ACPGAE_08250 [Neptuniibacter sp.]
MWLDWASTLFWASFAIFGALAVLWLRVFAVAVVGIHLVAPGL